MSTLLKTALLVVFGLELQKTIVILEISALKFIYFQNFGNKKKCLHYEKVPYLVKFQLELSKFIFIFEIRSLKFVYL